MPENAPYYFRCQQVESILKRKVMASAVLVLAGQYEEIGLKETTSEEKTQNVRL